MGKIAGFVFSVVAAAAVAYYVALHSQPALRIAPRAQTVYDRVFSSGTLRCGFFEEAPFTMVDPNSGAKSGIAVDLAEKIASELGLRVEWVSGFNFGTVTEDLRDGRFDAVCSSLFILPRAGKIDYTIPYVYVPVDAYTQAGRNEFDNQLDQLDWSKITVAGLDGEGATTVARAKLPQAKFSILPQSSQVGEMLTSVADRKADIAFVMPTVFRNFEKTNPNLLQKITSPRPFHTFVVTFGMKADEPAFKDTLDYMMRMMVASGEVQDLFKKYDPDGLLIQASIVPK